MDYKSKYLKYKKKYMNLRGGSNPSNSGCYRINQDGSIVFPSQQEQYQYQLYQQQLYEQQLYQQQQEQQRLEKARADYIKQKKNKTRTSFSLLEDVNNEKELDLQKEKYQNEIEKIKKQHNINIKQKIIDLERLTNQLEECKENLKNLKEIAASNNWDITEKSFVESYFRKHDGVPDVREAFYPISGPFIYQKNLTKIEDEMTEYKHHEKIYSNYGDEDKGLDYEIPGRALSVKNILEKNIVAFLNSTGGRLFFGISDDLVIYGIPNVNTLAHAEHIQIKITNEICKNLIAHNITTGNKSLLDTTNFILFIWHNVYHSNEKRYVLEIQVLKGSNEYVYMTPREKVFFRGPATTIANELTDAIDKIDQRKDKNEVLKEIHENLSKPRTVNDDVVVEVDEKNTTEKDTTEKDL